MKKSFILLLAAAMVLVNLGSTEATHVSCGSTIYNNTVLDSDLICPTYGLFIGASNIILDGNGFFIRGGLLTGTNGISITNQKNVSVKNVNISKFDYGIYIQSSSTITLLNNTANANAYNGITLAASSGNTLVNNTASSSLFGFGIYLSGSSGNTLMNNTANFNKEGISLSASSNNTLMSNTANSNFAGIDLYLSSNNTLMNNTANANLWQGFYLYWANTDTFTGNIANSNGITGISLYFSSGNIFKNNIVGSNPDGIYFYGSSYNFIYNNFLNNTVNARDSGGVNFWNTTKTSGTNIIGGPFLGGNFWSDYRGRDLNGDGFGDTGLPHNSSGGIAGNRGDFFPLVRPPSLKTSCPVPAVC